jgi:ribosomal protein S18 acetylase RimI-like enzyme
MPVQVGAEVKIRPVAPEDVPSLEKMYGSYSELGGTLGVPPPDPALRQYWLDELSRGASFIAYVDGDAVGHLAMLPTGGAVQLMAWVHQSMRRKGIATTLAKAAIEQAHLDGFYYIWLVVDQTNIAAQRWLQKLGFRVIWQDGREMQFLRSTASSGSLPVYDVRVPTQESCRC